MKTYLLFINKENSVAYARDCFESCKRYGLETIAVTGITDIPSDQLGPAKGLKFRSYNPEYSNEYACTVGHIEIWKRIVESNEPGIILEHDALVVSEKINDIVVKDGEILFLGPRVFSRNDYEYPGGDVSNIAIDKFQGSHAYAVTPTTAQQLLDACYADPALFPVDGILGLRNPYRLKLVLTDPPVAVGEIGDRGSFTNQRSITVNPTKNFINVEYNHQHLPGFRKGLKPNDKSGYDFTVDWFSEHIPHWEESMRIANIDKNKPLRILEIGSYEGRSTTWIADNLLIHKDSSLRCCDTFQGSTEHNNLYPDIKGLKDRFMWNITQSKNRDRIYVEACTSNFLFAMMSVAKMGGYDIIYIDGSHETEQVLYDGINAFGVLKDTGIMIFDDYLWEHEGKNKVRDALYKLEEILPITPIVSGWQRTYVKGRK